MRRLFFGNVNSGGGSGGTNPTMTMTAVILGGNENIGFLLFGGVPTPNNVFINGKEYKIKQMLTNALLQSSNSISVMSFEGSVFPCNSITFDINGTEHTFTNNGKAYSNNDDIFTEGETYTIKLVSTT